jgi:hypoxanthine phosphoribosyltransferase
LFLNERTEALATEIFNDCNNEPLICLCVLKSGYKFFSDLTERIQTRNRTNGKKSLPMMIDFIQLKYCNVDAKSSEEAQIVCLGDMSSIREKVCFMKGEKCVHHLTL